MEFLYLKTKNQSTEFEKVFDIFGKPVKYFKVYHKEMRMDIFDLNTGLFYFY